GSRRTGPPTSPDDRCRRTGRRGRAPRRRRRSAPGASGSGSGTDRERAVKSPTRPALPPDADRRRTGADAGARCETPLEATDSFATLTKREVGRSESADFVSRNLGEAAVLGKVSAGCAREESSGRFDTERLGFPALRGDGR